MEMQWTAPPLPSEPPPTPTWAVEGGVACNGADFSEGIQDERFQAATGSGTGRKLF